MNNELEDFRIELKTKKRTNPYANISLNIYGRGAFTSLAYHWHIMLAKDFLATNCIYLYGNL